MKKTRSQLDTNALRRLVDRKDHRVVSWPTCDDCTAWPAGCQLEKTKESVVPLFGCCRRWRGGPLEPGLFRATATQKTETFWSRCMTVANAVQEIRIGSLEDDR
jgi:hypothetical protein